MGLARFWSVGAIAILLLAGCARTRSVPHTLRPSEEARGIYHVVEKKQTLWRICRAYGVNMQDVAEINDIRDVTKIRIGQKIFIPGATRPIKVVPYSPPNNSKPPPNIKTFHGKFIWPVNGRVNSAFGVRKGIKHSGIDIAAPNRSPIKAAASGRVIFRGTLRGYSAVEQRNKARRGYIINFPGPLCRGTRLSRDR
jgi:murein DD-endopeptidase MepM/ murein hydrolase activator NlpD